MSGNIFSNTVAIGENNSLAWDLAQEVVLHPCGKYSLVYLYGTSGVGKSLMLQAIERGLQEHHPTLNVLLTTVDQMIQCLIDDIIHKSRCSFDARYQDTDVLLVDDIHHLVGKETTQAEIVKLFNAFYDRGKQIVITSDRPACEFASLNRHIHRRLESMASAQILEPGPKVRCMIVEREAERLDLALPENIRAYLAEQVGNPFQLQGLVRRVAACCELQKMPLDTDHVQACLRDILEPRPMDADKVLRLVCRYFNVENQAILGTSRVKGIGTARQVLAYMLYRHGKLAIPEIGSMMNRDHTTILRDVRWAETERKKDGSVADMICDLEAMLAELGDGV